MQKFKLFLLSLTPLIIICVILIPIILNKTNFIKIHTITQNLKIIDANKDHNQALDVIEAAEKQNIEIPSTIINFDTHSDIYISHFVVPDYGAQIADWINVLFAEHNKITELYWVMPIEQITTPEQKVTFTLKNDEKKYYPLFGNTKKDPKFVNPNIDTTPYIQYFKLNTKIGEMTEFISKNAKEEFENYKPEKPYFKKVKVITCTENSLPDFKNKNIILSIDGDYISNSGYDTGRDFTNNREPQEIEKALSKMLETIKNKNIRPEIISMTLSPRYVPEEDIDQILEFFKTFILISGKKDAIQYYKRGYNLPTLNDNEEPKYQSF